MDLVYQLDKGGIAPTVAHPNSDAGVDLYSPEDFVIPAKSSYKINLKIHVWLPYASYGKIEGRSGMLINHQVMPLGGVIDEGYTGTIYTRLFNFSDKDYKVKRGDKVCQLIIVPVLYTKPIEGEIERETDRGDNGLGSTGI